MMSLRKNLQNEDPRGSHGVCRTTRDVNLPSKSTASSVIQNSVDVFIKLQDLFCYGCDTGFTSLGTFFRHRCTTTETNPRKRIVQEEIEKLAISKALERTRLIPGCPKLETKGAELAQNDTEVGPHSGFEMDLLPNEVLLHMFAYVDIKTILRCRVLGHRYNEVACHLLQLKLKNKKTSILVVHVEFKLWTTCRIGNQFQDRYLQDFSHVFGMRETAFRPSLLCRFDFRGPLAFNEQKVRDFLSLFGHNMKILVVQLWDEDVQFFSKFLKFLCQFAPSIEYLEIIDRRLLLKENFIEGNFHQQKTNQQLLDRLSSLVIVSDNFGSFSIFLKNMLHCAPNIKHVQRKSHFQHSGSWGNDKNQFEPIEIFINAGFSSAIKKFQVRSMSCDQSAASPQLLMKNVRLQKLTINCDKILSLRKVEKKAVDYVYYGIKFSHESLTSLKFKLDELWSNQFMDRFFDRNTCLKNVRCLRLGLTFHLDKTPNVLKRVKEVCPNISDLQLDVIEDKFWNIAPILWTSFRFLISLTLEVSVNMTQGPWELDSAFSGYTSNAVRNIRQRIKIGKLIEEAVLGESRNFSIADLQSLQRLRVVFNMGMRDSCVQEKGKTLLRNSIFILLLPEIIQNCSDSITIKCA